MDNRDAITAITYQNQLRLCITSTPTSLTSSPFCKHDRSFLHSRLLFTSNSPIFLEIFLWLEFVTPHCCFSFSSLLTSFKSVLQSYSPSSSHLVMKCPNSTSWISLLGYFIYVPYLCINGYLFGIVHQAELTWSLIRKDEAMPFDMYSLSFHSHLGLNNWGIKFMITHHIYTQHISNGFRSVNRTSVHNIWRFWKHIVSTFSITTLISNWLRCNVTSIPSQPMLISPLHSIFTTVILVPTMIFFF